MMIFIVHMFILWPRLPIEIKLKLKLRVTLILIMFFEQFTMEFIVCL
jgi:hypothetical protein